MPYRSSRTDPAEPILDFFGNPDGDGKDIHCGHRGLSKLEHTASLILASIAPSVGWEEDKYITTAVQLAVKLSNALYDELERPAREEQEKMDIEWKKQLEEFEAEDAKKRAEVTAGTLSEEDYRTWAYGNDPRHS